MRTDGALGGSRLQVVGGQCQPPDESLLRVWLANGFVPGQAKTVFSQERRQVFLRRGVGADAKDPGGVPPQESRRWNQQAIEGRPLPFDDVLANVIESHRTSLRQFRRHCLQGGLDGIGVQIVGDPLQENEGRLVGIEIHASQRIQPGFQVEIG